MIKQYSRFSKHKRLLHNTIQLWDDMVSPLCGIVNCTYAFLKQTYDPNVIALGAQLTDPTIYRGINGPVTYHIGGMGLNREDAMIKCLAESYERYISFMCNPEENLKCFFGSYNELKLKYTDDLTLDACTFQYFNSEQYQQTHFYNSFSKEDLMLWVRVTDIITSKRIWIPAHITFLGYRIKTESGEARINGAVSTGTAVHTDYVSCLYNSLLEIILIDAVMGHWYTSYQAYKIIMDDRTRHISAILQKSIPNNNIEIEFYWIPSKEFKIFNIACLSRSSVTPQFAIGLGADATLEGAMYKAYLEYAGTRFLSQSLAVLQQNEIDPERIQNLDDNVLYYALGNNSEMINKKFNHKVTRKASELPQDNNASKENIFKTTVNIFRESNMNIAMINLTNFESQQLGLVATKLWSPQLISLSLPSAVPINHQRFKDYGGVNHVDPHPYP